MVTEAKCSSAPRQDSLLHMLPEHLLSDVLMLLSHAERLKASQVCRRWRHILLEQQVCGPDRQSPWQRCCVSRAQHGKAVLFRDPLGLFALTSAV